MTARALRITPIILSLVLSACASLKLENADFGWPVESVIAIGKDNILEDSRYSIRCPVSQLALEEFQDSTALQGTKLRVLRNAEGYYFITGPKFKHVYVFEADAGSLSQTSRIEVSETGLKDPALNQRAPHVELVDDGVRTRLSSDSIVKEQ